MNLSELGQTSSSLVQGAIPETALARRQDTVALGPPTWLVLLAWAGVAGLAVYTFNQLASSRTSSTGPDAIDELAAEAARIRSRVAARSR